jgi:phosphoserine phosphatase
VGIDQREFAAHLRSNLNGAIDIVVQPAPNRRKKLFLADMDSTMIGQECIDELADFVGLKAHVAAITARAMRGEIAFEPALRERVALLKGLPVKTIDEVIEKHITLTPGGRTLLATMRANGAFTCLVSGGFTLFTDRIAAMAGFDEARANTLTLEGDKLAGKVNEPIFGRETKRATLIELRTRLKLSRDDTLVTGDGANDMDMIAEAGLGVAYHAKPKVADAAPARIDHNDLTALLYVQGYRKDEFVPA